MITKFLPRLSSINNRYLYNGLLLSFEITKDPEKLNYLLPQTGSKKKYVKILYLAWFITNIDHSSLQNTLAWLMLSKMNFIAILLYSLWQKYAYGDEMPWIEPCESQNDIQAPNHP